MMLRTMLVLAFVIAGCNRRPPEPKLVDVEGTVILDGVKLADGMITFVPEGGRVPQFTTIKAGQYSSKAFACKNRVEINSFHDVPNPDPNAPAVDKFIAENRIPARYNMQSTLSVQIPEDGPFQFDFNLKTR